jgi:hypothetical protein
VSDEEGTQTQSTTLYLRREAIRCNQTQSTTLLDNPWHAAYLSHPMRETQRIERHALPNDRKGP